MTTPQLRQIHVDHLITKHNIRQEYGDLEALYGTFEDGPDEIPVVSPNGSGEDFVVVGGNRRVEAARQAGTELVWCIVKPIPFDDLYLHQLVADFQHKELSHIERARGMRELMARGWSQKEVADGLGISESVVSRTLGLLDLCEDAQQAIAQNKLCMGIAELLIPLGPEDQAEVLPDILNASGKRSGKPTVQGARRIISEATMTEKERQAKEDEALARALERIAEETRQKQMPDLFDRLLDDDGEPPQAVHFLYYLMEALYQIEQCREKYSLDEASPDLLKRIGDVAASLVEEATKIQEVVR